MEIKKKKPVNPLISILLSKVKLSTQGTEEEKQSCELWNQYF